eukprot:365122-Chlamydomonas_euryale.AAC.57
MLGVAFGLGLGTVAGLSVRHAARSPASCCAASSRGSSRLPRPAPDFVETHAQLFAYHRHRRCQDPSAAAGAGPAATTHRAQPSSPGSRRRSAPPFWLRALGVAGFCLPGGRPAPALQSCWQGAWVATLSLPSQRASRTAASSARRGPAASAQSPRRRRCHHRLQVGPQIFGRVYKPKDYYVLDETADLDEDVQTQENAPVTPEMRRLLEFAEPWTTEPDFQRVRPGRWESARASSDGDGVKNEEGRCAGRVAMLQGHTCVHQIQPACTGPAAILACTCALRKHTGRGSQHAHEGQHDQPLHQDDVAGPQQGHHGGGAQGRQATA